MKLLRAIVESPYEPNDTNVLWIDTSLDGVPVLRKYANGFWTYVSSSSTTFIVNVDILPEASKQTLGKMYATPSQNPHEGDTTDEWLTVISYDSDGNPIYSWEQIGQNPDLSQFITKSVNNLENYYLKTQTFTQEEIIQRINESKNLVYLVVDELPQASSETLNSIYLVEDSQQENVYNMYITQYESSTYSWVNIGNTSIALSQYAIKDVDAVEGNIATFDANGNPVDGGISVEYISQLGEKVTDIQGSLLLSNKANATALSGRIIAAGEWNARNGFTTLVLQVSAGDVVRIAGRSGYSMDYAVYSEFNGTSLDETKAVQLGTVINGNVLFDKFVTIAANGYIATSSTSGYAAQDIYTQSSLAQLIDKMDEEIAEVYDNTLGLPSIHGKVSWTSGTVKHTDGSIVSSTTSKYSNLIAVHEGDSLRIRRQGANISNEMKVAAYDSEGVFLPAKSVVASTLESGYEVVDYLVPGGVAFIRVCTANAFADYIAAYPNDTPLIYYNDGDIDFIGVAEFLEKGFSASQFIPGYAQASITRGRWFFYDSGNSNIISTKAFPKDGIDYVGIASGKEIHVHQFDKNGEYISGFTASGGPLRKDNANWSSQCKFFLLGCGNASKVDDNITEVRYSYQNALSVKGAIIQTSEEYYTQKVSKGVFIHASVINNYENDKMAHGSRIIRDSNGNILAAYYHSTAYENESIGTADGVVLVKCNPCNLQEPTRINAMVKGETVGSFTQSQSLSPYDPNILKVDSTTYLLLMVLNDGNGAFVASRSFNPDTMVMGDTITPCSISYNGNSYAFSVAGLNSMVDSIYGRTPGATDVGSYPIMTAQFKVYNGYFYTFLWSLTQISGNFSNSWNGAIIRSLDGIAWEVVSVPPIELSWTSHSNWEAGFDILGDRAYVLFRNNANDSPICYYDLVGGSWSESIDLIPIILPYIASPNYTILAAPSRPEIYAYNGYIYAMQNVKTTSVGFQAKDVFRGMLCVWKMDSNLNVLDYRIFQNAFGVSYFSAVLENGFGYFAFTEDRTAKHQTQTNYNKRNISLMPIEFGTLIW